MLALHLPKEEVLKLTVREMEAVTRLMRESNKLR